MQQHWIYTDNYSIKNIFKIIVMKTRINTIPSVNTSENIDLHIDNLIDKVNIKLNKLKNKEYLIEYLVSTGINIDLAKKMVNRTP